MREKIRRCGVFDRDQSKKEAKQAMDILWEIAKSAKGDLSVTAFECASYSALLDRLEQELHSLMLPPGSKAILPDGIEYVRSK
jgi:hypothetical protein